jgi:glycosyltransferase involved in cell wall biosynthesis
MRVAYVCTDPGVPVFGHKGASVHVQAVLRVLVRAGVRVELVCARTGGDVPLDLSGVRVHLLPRVLGTDPAVREASAVLSDAAVAPMLTALSAEDPLDLVYERYALWGRGATAWAADSGTPSVLEVNSPLVHEQELHRTLIDREGAQRVASAAIGSATATIAVSPTVADWARARTPTPERVHVVPNGVDTERIRPTARPVATPDADPFVIGFVGTLKPWHGVDTLMGATALLVARDPSYRLLLVGDGPEAPTLADQAARYGIADHVQLTGSVAPERMPTLLGRMDIACAPYPPMDGFYFSPLKVQEYLAAGVPVVASQVGELPSTLAGGEWGLLVEPGNAAALAQAIAGLRADAPRRRRLRTLGRAAAMGNDWRQVVTRTLGFVGREMPGVRAPEVTHAGH